MAKSCVTVCFTYSLRMTIFEHRYFTSDTFRVWWGICIWLCYKFPTESNSERILKIGLYLVKLWARVRCLVFFWLTARYDVFTYTTGSQSTAQSQKIIFKILKQIYSEETVGTETSCTKWFICYTEKTEREKQLADKASTISSGYHCNLYELCFQQNWCLCKITTVTIGLQWRLFDDPQLFCSCNGLGDIRVHLV